MFRCGIKIPSWYLDRGQ